MAAALCYGVRGGGAQLCFHITPGNYDTDTPIQVLGELRRFLGGEKATLLWDGLPTSPARPGGGDPTSPPRHRTRASDTASCRLAPSPHRPVGLMTQQLNTQDP